MLPSMKTTHCLRSIPKSNISHKTNNKTLSLSTLCFVALFHTVFSYLSCNENHYCYIWVVASSTGTALHLPRMNFFT